MTKILFTDAVGVDPAFDRKLFAFYDTVVQLLVENNCSNNVEQEATLLMSNCKPNPVGKCPAGFGWGGTTVPDCGDTASRQSCLEINAGTYCGSTMPTPQKQGCH
jgi:hypothetical protein